MAPTASNFPRKFSPLQEGNRTTTLLQGWMPAFSQVRESFGDPGTSSSILIELGSDAGEIAGEVVGNLLA